MQDDRASDLLEQGKPLPFEHLFVPLVLDAREQLHRTVDPRALGFLVPEGPRGWERYLLTRLTTASAHAAHWQFEIFKTARSAFSNRRLAADVQTDAHYRAFVGTDSRMRILQLFGAFPALADLCAVLIKNWVSTVAEFVARLAKDYAGFKDHFPMARIEGPVIKVDPGLSDPHRGGRCVVRVHFANGTRLFYKPRSLASEAHFSVLVNRLNAAGIPFPLRAAECWDRESYGWMEEIVQQPCDTLDQVHAFYWRAGALLGLVHLARGIDFHGENLVAAGEFPILVDLETLLHPRMAGENHPDVPPDSLMRTGFLPQTNPQLAPYEWGALSRQTGIQHATKSWIHINQDRMNLSAQRRSVSFQMHIPALEGVPQLATEAVPYVQSGFRWVGEKVLKNDEIKREFGGWMHGLSQRPRRLIYRITQRYLKALEQLIQPESLREQQAPPVVMGGPFDGGESAIESEQQSLRQLDIPYFTQASNEPNLAADMLGDLPTVATYLSQLPVIADALSRDLNQTRAFTKRFTR